MQKTILLIFLFLIINNVFSQTIITKVGNVTFLDDKDSLQSRQLYEIAKICDCYINNYYSKIKGLNFLTDIEVSKDTVYYQLSYDNIYGNSVNNNIYRPKTKDYTTLSIRIKATENNINKENVLKLLDYGINHTQELKIIRSHAIRLSYYDRPKNLSLNEKKIKQILKSEVSAKIVNSINSCSKVQ